MTSARRGRPPASESPASLEEILSAAFHVFAKSGFDGTSVAALNRELGVSHNLIHQRFGSKEGLWTAAVDWAFGQIEHYMLIDDELATLAQTDLLAAVRGTVVRFIQLHSRHPDIFRMITVEGAVESPRLEYIYEMHVEPLFTAITTPLKSLIDRGVITMEDVRSLHFLVAHGATAPFNLIPLARRLNPADPVDPAVVQRHAEFVADMVVAGLVARGA